MKTMPAPAASPELPASYQAAVGAWHAFQTRLVQHTDLPNKDRRGRLRLIRTEDKSIITEKYGLREGMRDVTMPRGLLESTSMFMPFVYKGNVVTVYEGVEPWRVFTTYFPTRSHYGGGFLASDDENEAVVFLDGLKFSVAGNYQAPTADPSKPSSWLKKKKK